MPKRKTRVEYMPRRKPVLAFTVDRKAFADAVGRVARFVPERPPVPVLLGIMLDVGHDGVYLTATDYEETARLYVGAAVHKNGRVLLPGAMLARIVRNLSGETVRVESDGAVATLDDDQTTYRLLTFPMEDFPDMSTRPVADMSSVRPAPADEVEKTLAAHSKAGAPPRLWRGASRTRKPYEPVDLQPGAWIEWTRHTPVEGTTTVTETETIRGQVWSTAPGPRSVWAIPEGEQRPVHVRESTYGRGSIADGTYEKYKRLDEFPERS